MRNTVRLVGKLLFVNKWRIISIALTLALGFALSLVLMNIGINGIDKAQEVTSEEEMRTVVTMGMNYVAKDSVSHADIFLTDKTASTENTDKVITILNAKGNYFEHIGAGYYITDEYAYSLNPELSTETLEFTLDSNKITVNRIKLPNGEIFGGLIYIGENAELAGEKIATIDVFNDIDTANKYIKGANGITEVYGSAESAVQARTVYSIIFAMFIICSVIVIALFIVTYICKYKLFMSENRYSLFVMRLQGFDANTCAFLTLMIIAVIFTLSLVLGLALLYAIIAILGAFNINLYIISLKDILEVQWYTVILFFVPYIIYHAISFLRERKRNNLTVLGE